MNLVIKMPDYTKGKIYCLRSHQTDDVYVGSTVESLSNRKAKHKNAYKRFLNGKSNYVTSFEIIKYDDCYIELIEDCPCENKEQLSKKEGEYIRNMDCINKYVAGRTVKEYREDNKEKIKEKAKEYRENNKEKIKEYYEDNKEKIKEKAKEYRENNKEKIRESKKKYRENNKEKIKEYRENNKEKIQEYRKRGREKEKEKVVCECGSVVSKHHLARHKRTIKHQEFLEK